jgi:aspartyl-tRNA(Asn)/glutamyl-tRNA(Gln) amidotransferase subunit B
VNSVRFVMAVVESEARRQVALIEDGGKVSQETRSTIPTGTRRVRCAARKMRMTTATSRSRSAAAGTDRRLPEECRASLPELPDAKRAL